MSRDTADFSFASLDGMEMAAASGPIARVAGEAFINNLDRTSSASMDASNSLPANNEQGLSLA